MSKTAKPNVAASIEHAGPRLPAAAESSLLASTSFMALEQRMVFDGAAAAHAADTMRHHVDHGADHAWAMADADHDHSITRLIAAISPNFGADSGNSPADRGTAYDAGLQALVSSHNAGAGDATQFVFIAARQDVAGVLASVPADMRVVLLDNAKDGVDQIAQTLAGQKNITAIHIVADGSSTDLRLGNANLTAANMATTYAADLATIKATLAPNADIFVYGSAFGSGTDGAAAASQLSSLTGAYVAPATDRAATIAALASNDALVADRTTASSNAMQDPLLQSAIAEHNAAAGSATQVAFIESNLPDLADLLIAVPQNTRIVMLDASQNGMDQIAQSLQGMTGITAIHILSHGSEASLSLGTADLNAADMSTTYAADIAAIKASLAPNADILLYGCNFATGTDGDAAVHELANLTGATVAASTDITGAAADGGNWVLEDRTGTIDTQTIDASNWNGELTTNVNNGKGALLTVTNNDIYSVDIATGKATLVTAVPSSIGGVAFSGVANSLAVDQANGLIYYTDNAVSSSNVALFAYDFVNNQHILITSNVATFGVVPGSVGLGAAGATFANGKLYLGVDNPSGTEDGIYAITFTNGGKTITSATHLNTNLPLTNDWGDLGYDPVNNNLLSFDGADLTLTRIDPTTGQMIGSPIAMPSGAGYQGSQDMAGDVYAIGTTLVQLNPLTGAQIGSAVAITTNGSTSVGSANDAAGWTPPTATISGEVYWDLNANATLDAGDTGAKNVTVQIYTDVNNDGVINGSDTLIGTDTTGANGQYSFTGVLPGDYIVKVSDANGVLTGHTYSTAGGNTNANADVTLIGGTISNIDFGVKDAAPALDLDTTTTGTGYVASVAENAAGVAIANAAATSVTDSDNTTLASASVVLTGKQAGDVLSIGGTVVSDGASGTINGIAYTVADNAGAETISLSGAATLATYKSTIDAITLANTSSNPATSTRTFDVTVNDGVLNSNTAVSTLTVLAPPVANDDTFSTSENTAAHISPLANDTDVNSFALTVTQLNGTAITAGGAAVAIDHGTVALSTAGVLTYTPTTGYTGAETFAYTVSDGHGGTDTANVSGTIYAPPVAVSDTFGTAKNTAVTFDARANDTDVNGFALSITKINATAITAGGAAVSVTDGSVALNTDGTLTFTPTTGYTGSVPSFTYTESDGHGGTATATVTGTVYAPPVAVADTFTTPHDTTVTIDAMANDTDANGFPLSITAVNGSAITAGGAPVAVTGGTVILDAAGKLEFTPNAGYTGSPSFTYTVDDGHGGMATASVTGTVTDVAPVIFLSTDGTPQNILVNGNFVSNPSYYTAWNEYLASSPTSTVTTPIMNGVDSRGLDLNEDDVAVTLDQPGLSGLNVGPGTNGAAQVVVDVSAIRTDNGTPAKFEIEVGGVLYGQIYDGNGGSAPVSYYNGASGVLSVAGQAANAIPDSSGARFANGDAIWTINLPANIASNGDFKILFDDTPATSGVGSDIFIDNAQVLITGTSNSATFTESGAPVAIADGSAKVTDSDNTTQQSASIVLTNAQAGDVLTVGTLPSDITATVDTSVAGKVTVSLSGNATTAEYAAAIQAITFSNTSQNPSSVDRTIDVTTNDGILRSNTAVSTIHVVPVDTAPVETVPATATVVENTATTISGLSVSDVDANGGTETVTLSDSHGTLTLGATTGLTGLTGNGTRTVKFTGTLANIDADIAALKYTPTSGYTGADTLTFTTDDNGNTGTLPAGVTGLTATQTTAINVVFVDHAPSGADKTVTTAANAPYTFATGDFGFTDPNDSPANNLKAVEITTLPANGTLTDNGVAVTAGQFVSAADIASGKLVWAPDGSAPKPGSFTFQVQDDGGTANGGVDTDPTANTMTIALNEVVARNDANANYKGITQTGNVLSNDTAFDGGALSVTQFAVAGTAGTFTAGQTATISGVGSLTINADGSYRFVPLATYTGTAPVVTYTVADASDVVGSNVVPAISTWHSNYTGGAPSAYTGGFGEYADTTGTGPLHTEDYTTTTVAMTSGQTYSFNFNAQQSSANPGLVNAQFVLFDPNNLANYQVIGPALSTGGSTGTATGTTLGTSLSAYGSSFTFNEPTGNYKLGLIWQTPGVTSRDMEFTNLSLTSTPPADVNGTATAQLALTVNPYSPPVANADTFVSTNGSAVTIQPLVNDTDPESLPLTITQINGTAITAGGAGVAVTGGTVTLDTSGNLTYTPTTGYTGSPSFTYTETDGVGTATGTVTGTVTNPPLALDLSTAEAGTGHASTFTQGQGPDQVTAADETLTGGTGTLTSATVVLTNAKLGDSIVATDIAPGITYNTDTSVPGQITYTMSGSASTAVYQALIQSLQFSNASLNPDTTARTIDISATDGTHTTNVAVATVNVVHVNQAPVIGAGTPVYVDANGNGQYDPGEASPLIVNGTLSSGASAANDKTFTKDFDIPAGTDPNQVRLVIDLSQDDNSFELAVNGKQIVSPVIANLTGTDTTRSPFSELVVASTGQDISQPWVGNANGLPRVEMVITNDGVQFWGTPTSTSTALVQLNLKSGQIELPQFVTGQNTISFTQVDGSGPDSVNATYTVSMPAPVGNVTTYTEGGSAVALMDGGATTWDIDSPNLAGATVVLTGVQAGDRLNLPTLPAGVSATTDTSVPGQITLDLTGSATPAAYQSLLKAITFSNSGQNPMSNDRTATIEVNDGQLNSNIYSSTIHVVPVDNAPVETAPATQTATEDSTLTVTGLSVSDVDANGGSETVTLSAGHGTITLGSTANLTGVTGNGTGSITFSGTLNDIDNAVASLAYTPTTGYVGADALTFTTNDNGNSGTGGPLSATKTIALAVNDAPPTAGNDSFTTVEDKASNIPVLANDSTVLGNALTVTRIDGTNIDATHPVTLADGSGVVTLNSDQTLTFTPTNGFVGTPTFTYTIADGRGGTATAAVNGTVIDVPPIAHSDAFTTPENSATIIPVLSNDTTVSGNTLAVTAIDGVAITAGGAPVDVTVGKVALDADGTLTFTPNVGFVGTPSFTYTVSDGKGGTAVAVVSGSVASVPPTLANDTFTTPEDQATVIAVLANDSTLPGNTLTITEVNGSAIVAGGAPVAVAGGAVKLAADGTLTFTPTTGYVGTPSFAYTASDGKGGVATATVNGTVTNVPPTAANDAFTTTENVASGPIAVLANDTAVSGNTLTITAIDGTPIDATHPVTLSTGIVSLNNDGTLTFTPRPGYDGNPTFQYTATDNHGGTSTANVVGTITPAPITGLAGDTGSVPENTALVVDAAHGVLANDTGPAGDPLAVASVSVGGVTAPAGTPAVIPGVGTLTVASDGSYRFAPVTGYTGPVPAATITVRDASGVTATETLALAIVPAPITGLAGDTGSVPENTALVVDAAHGVLANDTGPAGDPLAVASISVGGVTAPAGSPAVIPGVGTLTVASDGSYRFAPVTGYTGPVPAATITVRDASGVTATETLALAIVPAPITGLAGDTGSVPENTALVVDAAHGVLANDTGPAGDPLAVASISVGGVSAPAGSPAVIPGVGTLTVAPDGSYRFAPVTGYTGPVPAATITVRDASGVTATETLALAIVPAPITGLAGDTGSVPENTALVVDAAHGVLANDTGPAGDPLAVASISVGGVTAPAGSPAVIPGVGTLTVASDGSYRFAPVTGYTGPVPAATITVRDASGVTATETLALAIVPAPITGLAGDTGSVPENTALVVDAAHGVLANDTGPAGDPLAVASISVGGVTAPAGTPAVIPGVGTLTVASDGSYRFAPVTGYTGPVPAATITVRDASGVTATETLALAIVPAPITGLAGDTGSVPENTALVVDAAHGVLANDTGPAGDPLAVASISVGGVTAPAGSPAVIPGVGTLTVASDGSYRFAPVTGYTGPVPAATITVRDASGVTATETLALAIVPAPITGLAGDTGSVPENTALVVDAAHGVLANDTGPAGDPLAVASVSVGGVTATAGAPAVIPGVGTLTVASDGSYRFAPVTGYTGPVPAATITVRDASGVTATETLALAIVPAPITGLAGDTGSVPENTALVVDAAHGVLANDTGPAGDPLAVASISVGGVTAPAGTPAVIPGVGTLTVASDGSYRFAPVTGYTGPVPAATITVRDASGVTATETLALAIVPAPITGLAGDTGSVPENTALVVDAAHGVLANDTGPAGDPLAVASISVGGVTAPAGSPAVIPGVGTLTVASDGSYRFAPVTGYTGPVPAATITVRDASGVTATETLALAIVPAPITGLAGDTGSVPENTALVVDAAHGVLANDTGPAGDPLAVASISVGGVTATAGQPAVIPGVGTLTVAPDGSYRFAPVTGYTGPVPAATITVRDASGVTATETLAITATDVAPTATSDAATTTPNVPVTIDVLANDTKIAGNTYTITEIDGLPISIGHPVTLPGGAGTVAVNRDGTLTYTPPPTYYGDKSFIYTIDDGKGGTSSATVDVTIEKPSTFPAVNQDPANAAPSVANSQTPALAVSGIVVDAVEQSGLRSAVPEMGTERIVVATVNSVQSLNGMAELPDGHGVIGYVNRTIEEQRGRAAPSEPRQGLDKHIWAPQGLTGFSLHSQIGDEAADRPNSFDHKLVVDTLVRDGALYIQLKDTSGVEPRAGLGLGPRDTRYSVLRADGRPIPDWMVSTGQGLLIGQHPVDVERIELRIVATFADGSTITRYLSIDTTTGEIKPLKDRHAGLERRQILSSQFASLEPHDFDHRAMAAALQD